MCGIAGIFSSQKNSNIDLRIILNKMLENISHRGPDDLGIWSEENNNLFIGHRRLSINDLSKAGKQPFLSKGDRYVISFNGEIYNHNELRSEINLSDKLLSRWVSNSDTETFIEYINIFGLDKALNNSKGMFAFALWDTHKNKMYLVRDRFGEKPLYWTNMQLSLAKIFAFASEISAFNIIPDFLGKIDKKALSTYFKYGFITQENTIYEQIKQVNPGNYLVFEYDTQNFSFNLKKEVNWWNCQEKLRLSSSENNLKNKFFNKSKNKNYYENKLEDLLKESIRNQIKADAPVGVFLSGGIDSSLITALSSVISSEKINTFTVSFPDMGNGESFYDESKYARDISNYLGTNHTEVEITYKEALSCIDSLAKIYSEPFADSSQLPTYLVCSKARKSGLKVVLSGDGGDELFGGYNRHIMIPQLSNIFSKFPNRSRNIIANLINTNFFLKKRYSQIKLQKLSKAIKTSCTLNDLYDSILTIFPSNESILNKKWIIEEYESIRINLPTSSTNQEKIMLADILNYLPYDLLTKVDRAAMSVGLENRSPFLDHRVAEFAFQLPLEMKINNVNNFYFLNYSGKFLLKSILEKYLPKKLFDRPKTGFAMPINLWLRGPLKKWANDLLDPTTIDSQGYLKSNIIRKLWDDHINLKKDNSNLLWTILMWQKWLDEYQKI